MAPRQILYKDLAGLGLPFEKRVSKAKCTSAARAKGWQGTYVPFSYAQACRLACPKPGMKRKTKPPFGCYTPGPKRPMSDYNMHIKKFMKNAKNKSRYPVPKERFSAAVIAWKEM